MQIPPEHEENIRRIIGELRCPRARPCYACDYETLGRVRAIGTTDILDCLEERGRYCQLGLPFGDAILCMCPLRKYLADKGLA
jgi:hypothetical protein